MDVDAVKALCAGFPGASSTLHPEPSNVLVYYVRCRRFAYFKTSQPERWRFSVRTSPERFLELTDVPGVRPARFFARYHWITIVDVAAFPEDYLRELVEWSYARARDQQMANLISRYLPKASTGRDQQLIARGPVVIQPSAQVASAAAHSLPKIAPIPAGRPSEVLPVTAYAQEQAKADEDMLARIVAQDVVRVAAVTEAKATDGVDPVHTASAPAQVSSQPTSSASGQWVIQVASMPTKSEALRFLEEMKERVGGELAHANPFTEVFQHKGKTFHRARFGGFEDKVSAWSACENLKKQKIQCFATMAN